MFKTLTINWLYGMWSRFKLEDPVCVVKNVCMYVMPEDYSVRTQKLHEFWPSRLWLSLPVSGSVYPSLVWPAYHRLRLSVSGSTYLSLALPTRLWFGLPVSGSAYLSLALPFCLWLHLPVSGLADGVLH